MMRLTSLFLVLCTLAVLWQDCGENFALFCYRIGWGTVVNLRHTLIPILISSRPSELCSNPSSISCTEYMMLKD